MKRNLFLGLVTATLLFLTQHSNAQKDSSGLYLTVDDYKAQKLFYPISNKDKDHLKSYMLFNAKQIKINFEGRDYFFNKDEIYGFRGTDGIEYRFVGIDTYKQLNSGETILLYELTDPSVEERGLPVGAKKYFFTRDPSVLPIELTRNNLVKAFPENVKFQQVVHKQTQKDEDLIVYDKKKKTYSINEMYKSTVQ
jgi:hypothetical protein